MDGWMDDQMDRWERRHQCRGRANRAAARLPDGAPGQETRPLHSAHTIPRPPTHPATLRPSLPIASCLPNPQHMSTGFARSTALAREGGREEMQAGQNSGLLRQLALTPTRTSG